MYFEWLYTIEWFGNTGRDFAWAVLWFALVWLGAKLLEAVVLARLQRWAERTKTNLDDLLIKTISALHWVFYLVLALYVSTQSLELPSIIQKVVYGLFLVVAIWQSIHILSQLLEYFLQKFIQTKINSQSGEAERLHQQAMLNMFKIVGKVVLWCVGLLLLLSNLGINVTSLIASLGIGGIAVALALQNVLGDLFSSFSLYLDKPFQVGDFITIGKEMGTVEKIGLKTTRIRSLSGEQLVVSNQELTSSRIQNYGRMQKRRVAFQLGVVYGTSEEKLKKIPSLIKEIVTKQENADFDRCHFFEFADSSLNFEVVFFVNSPDYNTYMEIRQSVNLAIYGHFKEQGIEFAYPTQTLFLEKPS